MEPQDTHVDAEPRLHHEHRTFSACALHLEAGEWSKPATSGLCVRAAAWSQSDRADSKQGGWGEGRGCAQALCLVWVLRDPPKLRAAVDHAHLHLEDDARLPRRACVVHGHLALKGGRHEGGLDPAADTLLVGLPKGVGEQAARDAAVDDGGPCQLAGLDDHAVDDVDGRHVPVALAPGERGSEASQQVVVLYKPGLP